MYAPLDLRFAMAVDTVHQQCLHSCGLRGVSFRWLLPHDFRIGIAARLGRIIRMTRKLSILATILALAGFLFVFIAPEIPTPNVVVKSPQLENVIIAITVAPIVRAAHSTASLVIASHAKALPRTASLIDITCVRLC
jgi:hypothetical protein